MESTSVQSDKPLEGNNDNNNVRCHIASFYSFCCFVKLV